MRMIVLKELAVIAGGGDGCTMVPDAPFGYDFRSACDRHDANYSSDSSYSREQADAIFKSDMHNICATNYNDAFGCNVMAEIYGAGVSLFGGAFYEGGGNARRMLDEELKNELF